MDTLTPLQRSEQMRRVRSNNTKPELVVRKVIHGMGFRFRLHARDLPGTPDIIMPKHKLAIFVHGCFWHRHGKRCRLTRMPKSHIEYWKPKLERNRSRDIQNRRKLRAQHWRVLVLWECQLIDHAVLEKRLFAFLKPQA